LLSIEEGVGKMRAAMAARHDSGLVIAGRTSAASITSVADAIARAKAYAGAGVDAIFLVGVKTRADLDAIAAEIKLPLILGGVGKELLDLAYLSERNVRVCLQGHQPFMAAVQAVHTTLKALRDGTSPDKLEGVADDETMKRLTRNGDYARWSKDWL
jgi:carboxyvinyl-carboxyphosphonate phosphorylmutase